MPVEVYVWGIYALTGGIAAELTGGHARRWADRIGRWWMVPRWVTGLKGMQRRTRMVFAMRGLLPILPLLPSLIVLVGMVIVSISEADASCLLAAMIGWSTWKLLRFSHFRGNAMRFKLNLLAVAAKRFVRHSSSDDSLILMDRLARHQDPDMRIAATNGYMELAPALGLPALLALKKDLDVAVRQAVQEAHDKLKLVAAGKQTKSLRPLRDLIDEHARWKSQIGWNPINKGPLRNNLRMVETEIEDIIYSQLPQRKAFPHLYCRACNTRAEQLESARWSWVRCKTCMEAGDLEMGVQTVVGQIGGFPERVLEAGELRFSIWDEPHKAAISAELDVIEVIGGYEMNYDWAVSAVVEALQHRQDASTAEIKLRLTNAPILDQNTLRLLDSIVGKKGSDAN